MNRRVALIVAVAVLCVAAVWALLVAVPRWYARQNASTAPAAPAGPPASDGRRIKAHLFYVSDDGLQLTSVERDVPYGEGTAEQAKAIVNAQIAPVNEPLVSAVPAGTTLRALFVTPDGDAYVDLSREIAANHPGGSEAETLTVYTIVQALTVNLPAIRSVQLLVDGKQPDTLAGHVDLRRPLVKNAVWIQ